VEDELHSGGGAVLTLREGLNVESGLNDGICVPILFVFLALASEATMERSGAKLALVLVVQQIGIGAAVGLGLTAAGGWILKRYTQRNWITETWQQIPVVALAFVCFAAAQVSGGSCQAALRVVADLEYVDGSASQPDLMPGGSGENNLTRR